MRMTRKMRTDIYQLPFYHSPGSRHLYLSIFHYFSSWKFGIQCFFGGAGCDSKCGVRGTMFVVMYAMGYFGTANLTRFSEGATYVAVVNVSYCCNCIKR